MDKNKETTAGEAKGFFARHKRKLTLIFGIALLLGGVTLLLFNGPVQRWIVNYAAGQLEGQTTVVTDREVFAQVPVEVLPEPSYIPDAGVTALAEDEEDADDYYDEDGNAREGIIGQALNASRTLEPPEVMIEIPKIRLKKGVYYTQTQQQMYKKMRVGAAFYPTTAQPGTKGNVTMAAHRTGNSDFFRNINRLEAGDEILLHAKDATYKYLVTEVFVVAPTQVRVVGKTKQPIITLTTCEYANGKSNGARLVVRGKLDAVATE